LAGTLVCIAVRRYFTDIRLGVVPAFPSLSSARLRWPFPSAGQPLPAFGESPCPSGAGRDPSRKGVEQQKVRVLVALDGTPSLNGVEDSNCLSELTLFGRSISLSLQALDTCLGALSGLTWSARLRLYVVDRFSLRLPIAVGGDFVVVGSWGRRNLRMCK